MFKLSNRDISNPDYAVGMKHLMSKPLSQKTSWQISDIFDASQEQFKKFSEKQRELIVKHNGVRQWTGEYNFDRDNPVPIEFETEMNDLLDCERDYNFESVKLPEKSLSGKDIEYEPIIFYALKKILAR